MDIGRERETVRIPRREPMRREEPIPVPDWPRRDKDEPIPVPDWPVPERAPEQVPAR